MKIWTTGWLVALPTAMGSTNAQRFVRASRCSSTHATIRQTALRQTPTALTEQSLDLVCFRTGRNGRHLLDAQVFVPGHALSVSKIAVAAPHARDRCMILISVTVPPPAAMVLRTVNLALGAHGRPATQMSHIRGREDEGFLCCPLEGALNVTELFWRPRTVARLQLRVRTVSCLRGWSGALALRRVLVAKGGGCGPLKDMHKMAAGTVLTHLGRQPLATQALADLKMVLQIVHWETGVLGAPALSLKRSIAPERSSKARRRMARLVPAQFWRFWRALKGPPRSQRQTAPLACGLSGSFVTVLAGVAKPSGAAALRWKQQLAGLSAAGPCRKRLRAILLTAASTINLVDLQHGQTGAHVHALQEVLPELGPIARLTWADKLVIWSSRKPSRARTPQTRPGNNAKFRIAQLVLGQSGEIAPKRALVV
mmetsp:Transcript_98506/g.234528  ORF Transcript_98506/g.234528 Transcript_98506/m.234528 type:complete len:426 (+) Transcript_98506:105-1382(+)